MECRKAIRAKFAKYSENLAGETLRLPLQACINRGGVGLDCHFTFSPSQPCPELLAKPCPESQCHCRHRSLSCPASIAAVTRVPAPQFRVSSPSHCTSDRAFTKPSPRAHKPYRVFSEHSPAHLCPGHCHGHLSSSAAVPLVQPIDALPQHLIISRALICQFRAISAIVSEPWFGWLDSE